MGIAIDNSGARVLSYIACLRRIFHLFQLSFIPLEPYPARYARHLPHAGKALSVVILFPHMCVFALTLWGKRYSRIATFPTRGRLYPSLFFFHICVHSSDVMGKAVFSYRSLPHWGRGTAPAVDRALSLIVDLRCISSFSFIRLESYPAGDTRETCHPQTFGHRPIYICGEAATTTLNPEV